MGVVYSGTYANGIVLDNPASENLATIAATGAVYNPQAAGVAVLGEAGTAWTVTNLGTVAASGNVMGEIGVGIELDSGGSVVNGQSGSAGGLIRPATFLPGVGVSIAGAAGTVTNYGSIVGDVLLGAGGSIINIGRISAAGITISGAAGSVVNSGYLSTTFITVSDGPGSVANSGTVNGEIRLGDGGGVTNAANGGLLGQSRFGMGFFSTTDAVDISGAAGTVVNLGSMSGIALAAGGSVTNGASGASAATITGSETEGIVFANYFGPGITIAGQAVVTNYGTIRGNPGIDLSGPATVSNSGTVLGNFLQSSIGVVLAGGGSLGNAGVIKGNAGGVVIDGDGVIENNGVIAATQSGSGVYIGAGGVALVNDGAISGTYGIDVGFAVGTGDSIINGGAIAGWSDGAVVDSAASLDNTGLIVSTGTSGAGLYLGAGGITLVNSGTIAGHYGILVGSGDTGGDTISNTGTIIGNSGTAAVLGTADRLILRPSSVFVGAVYGGGSVIELTGGTYFGTLTGLGTNFVGFGTVAVDSPWEISGSGPDFVNNGEIKVDGTLVFEAVTGGGVIAVGGRDTAEFAAAVAPAQTVDFMGRGGTVLLDQPGAFQATIRGFAPGDTIDLVGHAADRLSFSHQTLVVTENGHAVADLHLVSGRHLTASRFSLSPDGNGGTDISLTAARASLSSFWGFKT